MKRFISLLVLLALCQPLLSQTNWELQREEDGIRVYTRDTPDSPILSFRALTEFAIPRDRMAHILLNREEFGGWVDGIVQSRTVEMETGRSGYYSVYDAPWPVYDREFVMTVEKRTTEDGKVVIHHDVVPGAVPPNSDRVRIQDAAFTWTLTRLGEDRTGVEFKGYADPGGYVPAWVANLGVVDSPFRSLQNFREQFVANKPKP